MIVKFIANNVLEIGESLSINIGDISLMVFEESFHEIQETTSSLMKYCIELRNKIAEYLPDLSGVDIFHPLSVDEEIIKNINTTLVLIDGIWQQKNLYSIKQELQIRFLGEQAILLCTDNQMLYDTYKGMLEFNNNEYSEELIILLDHIINDLQKNAEDFYFILTGARDMLSAIWGLDEWNINVKGNAGIERAVYYSSIPVEDIGNIQNAKLALSIQAFRSMHERVQIRLNFRTEQQENGCVLHYSYECSTFLDLLYLDIAKMLEIGVGIKNCRNCGKPFIPENRKDEIYCKRIDIATGKACRDIGASVTYKAKIHEKSYLNDKSKTYSSIYAATVRKQRNNKDAQKKALKRLRSWSYEANNKVREIEESDEAGKEILIANFRHWLTESTAEEKGK